MTQVADTNSRHVLQCMDIWSGNQSVENEVSTPGVEMFVYLFTICNAGHPRPLWYSRSAGSWSFVNNELVETGRASNLPLGLDESTDY